MTLSYHPLLYRGPDYLALDHLWNWLGLSHYRLGLDYLWNWLGLSHCRLGVVGHWFFIALNERHF